MSEREWDAATYDQIAHPQARGGSAVVDRLILDGSETVLDAGCGSGRVTEMLLARVPDGHVIALDGSEAMIAAARERLSSYGGQVSYVCTDLLALTPESLRGRAPVDAVLSTATFHWVTDHDDLFRRIAGVLRPGGQLVAQCGGAGNIANLIATVASLGVDRAGDWVYADVATTKRRLTAAGFAIGDVWLHDEPTRFEPGREFEDFLETVCLRQHVATLPVEQRRPFVERVAAAMPEPVLDYVRLNIIATLG